MDPTVHGYSLTARKPASGVGATWGFAGTTPSRVASMRAYASGASDLSAVSKAPFFESVMRRLFRHRRRRSIPALARTARRRCCDTGSFPANGCRNVGNKAASVRPVRLKRCFCTAGQICHLSVFDSKQMGSRDGDQNHARVALADTGGCP